MDTATKQTQRTFESEGLACAPKPPTDWRPEWMKQGLVVPLPAIGSPVDCDVGWLVERGARRAVVAALVLVCAGCSVGERTDVKMPKGWRTFVGGGNNVTYVAPVTMEDGTRCVVAFGNAAGRGVSCEWPGAK